MFASELDLPICWESTYAGGAVRVSKTDFVNRRFINFDVDAIDEVLQVFCPDDYLPLMAVSSATIMHRLCGRKRKDTSIVGERLRERRAEGYFSNLKLSTLKKAYPQVKH